MILICILMLHMLIPTTTNTKTISDMRLDPVRLLDDISRHGGVNYIFHRSTPKAVMLSISDFEKLMEIVEDYRDSVLVQKLEKEDKSKIKWLTSEDLRQSLDL